jgi:hypothetical protein
MLTYMTTRFLAPIDAYPANAAPWFESAPYNLDACLRLLPRTEDASLMGPAELIAIPFRAQSAASAHPRTAFNPHTFTALAA